MSCRHRKPGVTVTPPGFQSDQVRGALRRLVWRPGDARVFTSRRMALSYAHKLRTEGWDDADR